MLSALADVYIEHVVNPSLADAIDVPDDKYEFDSSRHVYFLMCLNRVFECVQKDIERDMAGE